MRILILEDEPIIAIDLADIVTESVDAEIIHAMNLEQAAEALRNGIDFAILDIVVGRAGETSLPIARQLMNQGKPFCFVSSCLEWLPPSFEAVPQLAKPFRERDVHGILASAA